MRGNWAALALGLMLTTFHAGSAWAERLEVRISISQQKMHVYHEGRKLYEWPVSTAGRGSITPSGTYKPEFLSKNHRSRRYNNAPMPFAIFYDGNYAIHGTTQVKKLGRPASHGCVRLHPDNAQILFRMVKAEGMDNMRITIAQ
ncbi:L,D-transpeptidase [Rhodobacter sp. Har01]|uniref:L,D-transpeptidase n=1 Tax=Rhodobacter sp. Har01 TaxID=2883999 RepID=UPI001D096EC5|nr:L,D-transpeptidase [Rhodobacter sp. Har01]MCB6179683.1 L,D-transpeptidase [Rhodobacter sp. Har01]